MTEIYDIIEDVKKCDADSEVSELVQFASKYGIPIGKGSIALGFQDFKHAINPKKDFFACQWVGDNCLKEATRDLEGLLKDYVCSTNVVLYFWLKDKELLAELNGFVERLANCDADVVVGFDNSSEIRDNKLSVIVQKVK